MKQATFASLAWSNKGKVTRRERFLAEMDAVVPWSGIVDLIAPHYPTDGLGRPRKDLELMLRVYFLQQWFSLSDPQAEEGLYDSESMRRFAGVELGETAVPDESTILRFRHLLEEHQLTRAIFEQVRTLLEERNLFLKSGTIVDATIISAPSSTKNVDRERDPEMGSTRKGANWHFGMKVPIGTDQRGLTHELTGTSASVNDFTEMPKLLHGEESELYGERSYWSEEHRWLGRQVGIRYRVNRRGRRAHDLSPAQRAINRSRSRIRARVEHPFNVVSACGALPRCATGGGWPRTSPRPTPCSRSPTSISCDDDCCLWGRRACCERPRTQSTSTKPRFGALEEANHDDSCKFIINLIKESLHAYLCRDSLKLFRSFAVSRPPR